MSPRCAKTETTRTGAVVQCSLDRHPSHVQHEFRLPQRCGARNATLYRERCWSHEGHAGVHEFGAMPPPSPRMADDGDAP